MEIVLLGLLGTAGYYANRRKNTNPTSEKVTVTQLEN